MKSGQNNSTAHLGTMRQRRMKRIKRQRAIEVGKPVDTSLKIMALNPSQKRELSDLHDQPHDDQKHGGSMHSRVSILGSLAIHAIAMFIAAFYVVRTAQVDDEAVSVDFLEPIPPKRDEVREPMVKPPKPINTVPEKPDLIVPPVQPRIPENETVLPEDELEGFVGPEPIESTGINPGGIGKLEGFGPIKIPQVETGKPEDLFPKGSDEGGLGIINEPPDPENTPEPELNGDAFKPTEILRPPSFRNKVEPEYPSQAKRAGKEGTVVLEATIDVDGKAQDIKVKKDNVGFGCARAAIQALKASRFIPAKRGGKSVPQRTTIPYTFKIED